MVVPPISAGIAAGRGRPAASLNAVVKSSCAAAAVGSPRCFAPITTPGPNPTSAEPDYIPKSPVTMVRPVLVTVEPAKTAKLPADPRGTGACGAGPHRQTEDIANRSKLNFVIESRFRPKKTQNRTIDRNIGVSTLAFLQLIVCSIVLITP